MKHLFRMGLAKATFFKSIPLERQPALGGYESSLTSRRGTEGYARS